MVLVRAGIFPAELTALRAAGLLAAVAIVAYAIAAPPLAAQRRRPHPARRGVGLALVAGTEVTDELLSAFSFEKGNGGRILGLAVFAIFILFLLILRALSQSARNARQLSAALEGLAWEEFRQAGLPERFRDKVAVVIPAYNEADNIGHVLDRMPAEVCGVPTADAGRRRRLPRRDRRRRRRARRRPSPATSPTAAAARRCGPATG